MDSDPIEDSPMRRNHLPPPQNPRFYTSEEDSDHDLLDNAHLNQAGDTIATLPLERPFNPTTRTNDYITQPTQPIHTPDRISHILVPASSPPPSRPSANVNLDSQTPPRIAHQPFPSIAPPGTLFRPPAYQPSSLHTQTQFSDFNDPPIEVSDSEDDLDRSGDIAPSFRKHRSIQQDQFRTMTNSYAYNPNHSVPAHSTTTNVPQKRPANDSASAYSQASRPSKQQRTTSAAAAPSSGYSLNSILGSIGPPTPSSAPKRPVAKPGAQKMQPSKSSAPGPKRYAVLADIEDIVVRNAAAKLKELCPPSLPLTDIVQALFLRRNNVEDAFAHLTSRKKIPKGEVIDLSSDKDADGETDEDEQAPKKTANKNFQSIKTDFSKYSGLTQKKETPATPVAPEKVRPRKFRRLHQGARPNRARSSSDDGSATPKKRNVIDLVDDDDDDDAIKQKQQKKRRVVLDEEEEDDDDDDDDEVAAARQVNHAASEIVIEADEDIAPFVSIEEKAFEFLCHCNQKELVSIIDCKPEDAEFFLSKRPFTSLDVARQVARPLVPGKRRGGVQKTIGDRLVDLVISTEESLQAVDRVVDSCAQYSRDVSEGMRDIGIDVTKTVQADGLNLASFKEVDDEQADSGIGSPNHNGRLSQPSAMSTDRTLKDYQLVGLNWLNVMHGLKSKWGRRSGCILADEMGLGKTYQVIAFLSHLVAVKPGKKHLIIVPASTIENWLREFQAFAPHIHKEPYFGKKADRDEQQYRIEEAIDDVQVIVTTYNIATSAKDNGWLRRFDFDTAVFDEGHQLKNASTQRYSSLLKMKAKFRLMLTGTPLQNNLQELVSVLSFIMPDLFEEADEDLKLIFACKAKTADSDHAALLASERTNRAKSLLKPFILRRTKDQVLKDLPPKTHRVVYCDQTPTQHNVYEIYAQAHNEALEAKKAGIKSDSDLGVKFPHLQDRRSAAIHPLLRRTIYSDKDIRKIMPHLPRKGRPYGGLQEQTIFENLTWHSDWQLHEICEKYNIKDLKLKNDEWMDSGKVQKLVELLQEHKKTGSRTLVFSQQTKVLDILVKVLESQGISNLRLDGETPTDARLALIDLFNEDDSIDAFLITTRSGGAGINLASADKVIIFDSGFNPQDDVQAANRAHRIGQTRPVEVITLVTAGTIEEQIYKLGLSKLALDQRVAGADGDDDESGKKTEAHNMAKIESMLMKGQTTPADSPTPLPTDAPTPADTAEPTPAPATPADSGDEKPGLKGSSLKTEVKAETDLLKKKKKKEADNDDVPLKKESRGKAQPKDVKDEFMDAMAKKGVDIVKKGK